MSGHKEVILFRSTNINSDVNTDMYALYKHAHHFDSHFQGEFG